MDQSHLDLKYFIDDTTYNCPFCKRNNVKYSYSFKFAFDWSNEKECTVWIVRCSSCDKDSMHLTFENLQRPNWIEKRFNSDLDIDSYIFYSVPSSFFVIDNRIPKNIRELITEAEGSLKMNFLTGASACTRKAIYELLVLKKAEGSNYDDRIKSLKKSHPEIDPVLFDILGAIKDMTSDKVHEQSWDKWDNQNLKLFLETLKTILHEIFVIPAEKQKRIAAIKSLQETHSKKPTG